MEEIAVAELLENLRKELPFEIGILSGDGTLIAGSDDLRKALAMVGREELERRLRAAADHEPDPGPIRLVESAVSALLLHIIRAGENRLAAVLVDDSQRQMLEQTQEFGRVGVFHYDVAAGELSTSHELRELHHLNASEQHLLDPPHWSERFHPEDREGMERAVERALRSGQPSVWRARLASHPNVTLETELRCELDEHGQPRALWGTVRDVSEADLQARLRGRLELLLREAERIGQVGHFDHDPVTGEVFWSDGLRTLIGPVRPGDGCLTVVEALERIDDEFRDDVAQQIARVSAGGAPIDRLAFLFRTTTGRSRWLELSAESYEGDKGLRVRGVLREATAAHRAVRHHRELAAFGLQVVATPSRSDLVSLTTSLLQRELETPLTAVRRVDESGALVIERLTGWDGRPPSPFEDQVSTNSDSSVALAFRRREPVRVDDYDAPGQAVVLPPSLARAGVRSSICAPIIGAQGVHGVLSTHSAMPGHFSVSDSRFLGAVAALVAAAFERLSAEEGVRELANARLRLIADALAAEERARRLVSEQIHDGPLQDLLAARQDLIEAEQEGSDVLTAAAREGVDRAIAELRRAVHSLHPVVLQHGGLEAALQAAGEQAARATGLSFELAVDHAAVGLGDQVVVSFARELLTNVVKHASATRVELRVVRVHDVLEIDVIDDGVGADPDVVEGALEGGHIGLAALRHRAEALGGTLSLLPVEPHGTDVRVRLPLPLLPTAVLGSIAADRAVDQMPS